MPRVQVLSLLGGDAPPKPPCAASLRAVIMFADISGYSRITRWMANRFEEGPWATSQVLNKVNSLKRGPSPKSRAESLDTTGALARCGGAPPPRTRAARVQPRRCATC